MRVEIEVRGGCVELVVCDEANVTVILRDFDVEDADVFENLSRTDNGERYRETEFTAAYLKQLV